MSIRSSFPGILILVIVLNLYAGGVSEEVHTSFKAGPGYEVNESVHFLLTYHLYRVPEGIRQFPDGGVADTIFLGTFLMRIEHGLPVIIEELMGDPVPMNRIPYSSDKISGSKNKAQEYDMNVTNGLLRDIGPAVCGLPSPLEFMNKKRSMLLDDLVHLKGDLQYRKEIVRTVLASATEAEAILDRMSCYEQSLQGPEKTQYSIFAEDTRKALRLKAGTGEESI